MRAGGEGCERVLGPRCWVCVHQLDRKGLRSVFRFVKLPEKPIKSRVLNTVEFQEGRIVPKSRMWAPRIAAL